MEYGREAGAKSRRPVHVDKGGAGGNHSGVTGVSPRPTLELSCADRHAPSPHAEGPSHESATAACGPRKPELALTRERVSEEEWVARIRMGDAAVFKTLFLAYFEPLCAFAYGFVQSRDLAEEVVQEVLCRVWEHRADWVIRESVQRFLYGAVRNRALSYLTHQRVVERTEMAAAREDRAFGMGQGPGPTDERVRASQVTAAFELALARLPERTRIAVTLRLRNGLSVAQAAQIMGITAKGVEFHMSRGLRMLREQLAEFF